ncbi:MAG: quinolinate synthase NadA [Candidatus Lokiarchaeota archaeon]|nr:quinolinate synthase NadA [Candidatus Lokiarchaeota archaeon]MBD3199500.1 quinolinate synthase NadA [Candidatus Lokiarchaeota archaeon]
MSLEKIKDELKKLKKKKDVTILAHYYQPLEIQEIADYLGDSLGLSRIAKEKANSEYIIFAGVLFMAETASIINQDKKVLIPSRDAGCPLSDFLNPQQIEDYRDMYPELPIITYVNTTAEVKAHSDICCTSSNSVRIINKIAKKKNVDTVIFGPDQNLASYVAERTDIKIIKIPENGHCRVHSQLSVKDINKVQKEYPKAQILVHPECKKKVRDKADYIGSTSGIYNYVKKSRKHTEFIIGTEKGLLERLAMDFPSKKFYLASNKLICYNMKKNSLETIRDIMNDIENEKYRVIVPREIVEKAIKPLNRMFEYS